MRTGHQRGGTLGRGRPHDQRVLDGLIEDGIVSGPDEDLKWQILTKDAARARVLRLFCFIEDE
jgi:hypothetical protein